MYNKYNNCFKGVEIKMSIIEWFFCNLYTNIFTILTVVVSGLISWIISAYYFNSSNRKNLEMSVIYPICNVISKTVDSKNYEILEKLSKDYTVRYMKKNEKKQLLLLLETYRETISKTLLSAQVASLYSYFEYSLKKSGINIYVIPIEYNGEIVDYTTPSELNDLYDGIHKILNRYDYDLSYDDEYPFTEEQIEEQLKEVFKCYAKKYYSDTNIKYFDDYRLSDIIKNSEEVKKSDLVRKKYLKAKKDFLNLKICKDVKSV